MLQQIADFLTPSRFNAGVTQDPGLLCLMVTFLLCTDIHEVAFMIALVGIHQILPGILHLLLEPASVKEIYTAIYHGSKMNVLPPLIEWMTAPAVALSFYRSVRAHSLLQRLALAETRLNKLERKQAATAARFRRQRSNLAPEDLSGMEAAMNRLTR